MRERKRKEDVEKERNKKGMTKLDDEENKRNGLKDGG